MATGTKHGDTPKKDKDQGLLEKIAHTIDPPSREVSDDELIDPGANIPDDKQEDGKKIPAKRD
jgi:hypothetical protein